MGEKLVRRMHLYEAALIDTALVEVRPYDEEVTPQTDPPPDNRLVFELDPRKAELIDTKIYRVVEAPIRTKIHPLIWVERIVYAIASRPIRRNG